VAPRQRWSPTAAETVFIAGLLDRARQGDRAAGLALWTAVRPWLSGLLGRLKRRLGAASPLTAADLEQEAFLAFWEAVHTYRPGAVSFLSRVRWRVYWHLRSLLRGEYRRRRRLRAYQPQEPEAEP